MPELILCGDRLELANNFEYLGSLSHLAELLGRWSHHELGKPEQLSRIYENCGVAMQSGLPSVEGRTMPQFLAFYFAVARLGPFALSIRGDFVCSTTDVSEVLLVSGGIVG